MPIFTPVLFLLSVTATLAATEEELRAQILGEHPELATGTATQWEEVQALRAFAYEHTDTVVSVTSPLYSELGSWGAPDIYAWFDADAGGVVCGGTADALRKLYQLWGYDAWYLGFGDTSHGGFTHAENLVRIEHEGQELVTLHEAQLDTAYVTPAPCRWGAPHGKSGYSEIHEGLGRGLGTRFCRRGRTW